MMLRFAHFSVKEYLTSARISKGVSPGFRIFDSVAHELVARISLVYLLSLNGPTSLQGETFNKFPFLSYAANFWPRHGHGSKDKGREMLEQTLARRLFDSIAIANWLRVYDPDNPYLYPSFISNANFPPPL